MILKIMINININEYKEKAMKPTERARASKSNNSNEVYSHYSDLIKISKMSGKLEGIEAINTNSLSNSYCQKMSNCKNKEIVCTKCYSQRMLKTFRTSCISAFEHNSRILSTKVIPLCIVPRFMSIQLVRFNGHGELINNNHLINISNIIKMNPDTQFALWTKRIDLIKNHKKLKNCMYIYSSPAINKKIDIKELNKKMESFKFDKVFTVFTENYAKENNININCSGKKCINCRTCYSKNKENYINEIIKLKPGKLKSIIK